MVLVTVVIDEPRIAHQGGTVSAPLFRRVTEQTLRYLGRLPAQANAAPPPQQPAHGDRDRDATMERTSGSVSRASQTAAHEAQDAHATPDLIGMSARRAMRTLDAAGLTAVMSGTGSVMRQTPAAGEPLPLDGRVLVDLEPGGGAPEPRAAATSNEAADRSGAE
jgi:cell division protein FtsI (penicillin-binding protein 3)